MEKTISCYFFMQKFRSDFSKQSLLEEKCTSILQCIAVCIPTYSSCHLIVAKIFLWIILLKVCNMYIGCLDVSFEISTLIKELIYPKFTEIGIKNYACPQKYKAWLSRISSYLLSCFYYFFSPIIFHELNYKNKKRLFMKTISAIRNVYMGIMIWVRDRVTLRTLKFRFVHGTVWEIVYL